MCKRSNCHMLYWGFAELVAGNLEGRERWIEGILSAMASLKNCRPQFGGRSSLRVSMPFLISPIMFRPHLLQWFFNGHGLRMNCWFLLPASVTSTQGGPFYPRKTWPSPRWVYILITKGQVEKSRTYLVSLCCLINPLLYWTYENIHTEIGWR